MNPYQSPPEMRDEDENAQDVRDVPTITDFFILLICLLLVPFISGIAGAVFWIELVLRGF